MNIIERLLKNEEAFPLKEHEVIQLLLNVRKVFLGQPMLLELTVPINICGDIHGHYDDLLNIFSLGGSPDHCRYLFLGDYVDRGPKQLHTICLLFAYKIMHQNTFFMLRGNHECDEVCREYGFYHACIGLFNNNVFKLFIDVFNCMPVAAVVQHKMFCVHGGLSPDLHNLEQIRNIQRPVDVPEHGLLCDLLWSDPSLKTFKWKFNTGRGTSVMFSESVVTDFLRNNSLEIICRAHEIVPRGFQFFAGLGLVTIFSTTNYKTNDAAFMKVDEKLHCTFQTI